MKKLLALILALTMVFGLAVNASADTNTYTLTISGSQAGHTYTAYQIFTGDLSNAGTQEAPKLVLSNVVWGSGVSENGKSELLSFGKNEGEAAYADAAALAEALSESNVKSFANAVSAKLGTKAGDVAGNGDDAEIKNLNAGYYLVLDTFTNSNGSKDEALSSYMIKVVGDATVSSKHAKPTVDKQVLDEDVTGDKESGSSDGWGETADHAINETFQFKLIATLPEDDNYNDYSSYKLIFNDSMSQGITFESIVSVKVGNTNITNYTLSDNLKSGELVGPAEWSLTVPNLKTYVTDLSGGATVEVIYKAHLNQNAAIGDVPNNWNKVNLQYSNNPNVGGEGDLGKTPDDTVWVFTYTIESTKYKDSVADANKMAGAGFTLYTAAEYAKINDKDDNTVATPVSLIKDSDGYYYPSTATGAITQMVTGEDGKFDVKGLDVGTYYLVETLVPTGYNKCDDVTVVISATHKEETADDASTDLSASSSTTNQVVNKKGTELPETGGMGTTLFYVIGGIMVAAALVLLVTKKRMSVEG